MIRHGLYSLDGHMSPQKDLTFKEPLKSLKLQEPKGKFAQIVVDTQGASMMHRSAKALIPICALLLHAAKIAVGQSSESSDPAGEMVASY